MKPLPHWNCQHQWMQVGPTYVTWLAYGTGDSEPPVDAPKFAEFQCALCGGYRDLPVQVSTDLRMTKQTLELLRSEIIELRELGRMLPAQVLIEMADRLDRILADEPTTEPQPAFYECYPVGCGCEKCRQRNAQRTSGDV